MPIQTGKDRLVTDVMPLQIGMQVDGVETDIPWTRGHLRLDCTLLLDDMGPG